jgi:hypothetical protein
MKMHERLKRLYFVVLTPALFGFVAVYLLQLYLQPIGISDKLMAIVAQAIFMLAVLFALAGPIFYRSLFAHRQRYLSDVSQAAFFKFECRLTAMALVTPYFALAAYFLQLPRLHLAATLLMTLYAIYYYYPSRKRVGFDMQIFRAGKVMSINRVP